MRESASLNILARQSDVVSLVDQRGKGECFGSAPVDSLARCDGFLASLENLDDLGMELTLGRQNSDFLTNRFESLKIHSSVFDVTIFLWVLNLLPL